MSHTESVRPSSWASCGRAGRSPPITIETMTGGVKPLNGYLPVKTFHGIQTSGKLPIHPPPIPGIGRTNLCYNHTKSENICFLCDFVTFLENFRRGPRLSIPLYLSHENRVQPANNRGEPEIRQTCTAVAVNEDVGLAKGCQCSSKQH